MRGTIAALEGLAICRRAPQLSALSSVLVSRLTPDLKLHEPESSECCCLFYPLFKSIYFT
ncbi:hypothetical protein M407DRAFT_240785 [Tulasnella calospora MUT 4182]|uniref:Uncharacterized protein n=1 Tax=Tulasnella calospora MUT 4182 TaxID=1051891 RepID=A0A0C3QYA1_9AGAM|nr:hypothetical protein M407DRAFT_240785 [Tulasnella calospora MUT 4182]